MLKYNYDSNQGEMMTFESNRHLELSSDVDFLLPGGALSEIDELKPLVSKILKGEIKYLKLVSPVAVRLLKLANDETSSLTDLTDIIKTSSSLSLQVLHLANSAYYNFFPKVNSIQRAVTLLGFSTIRQIALNILFFKQIIKPKSKRKFNQIFFWQHCLFVAILSKKIAIEIKHPEPDLIYAAGLMHDIGKIVLENYGRLSYSDFIDTFEKSKNTSLQNEHNFFGLTHAEIGAVYCKENDLPDCICDVVLKHHSSLKSFKTDTMTKNSIAIIAYANYIAWFQDIGSIKQNQNPVLQEEVLEIIHEFNIDIESILDQVDKEIQNIAESFNIHFPNLNKLRANLIKFIFHMGTNKLNRESDECPAQSQFFNSNYLDCMTIPHHSLNPQEFMPWTLEAIHKDYHFDRLIIMDIEPKRRCLIAKYYWPENIFAIPAKQFEIMLSSFSGSLLSSLRNKQAVLINDENQENNELLHALQVNAFFSLPILSNNKLSSILYIDNAISGNKLEQKLLPELNSITTELSLAMSNAGLFKQEKKKAQSDPLTEMNNKGMINQFLKTHFNENFFDKLSIGFIDIDYFKHFNDSYGHKAGDDVLKIVADILKSLTRPTDLVGRYGGEEFLFVLIDTDEAGVRRFAERIRMEIEQKGKILHGRFPKQYLTVSIGVAMYNNAYKNYQMMIDAADNAMYQSKKEGRNRVTIFNKTHIDVFNP